MYSESCKCSLPRLTFAQEAMLTMPLPLPATCECTSNKSFYIRYLVLVFESVLNEGKGSDSMDSYREHKGDAREEMVQ